MVQIRLLAISIVAIGVPASALCGDVPEAISQEYRIQFDSVPFLYRGDAVLTHAEIDGYIAKLPASDALSDYLNSPSWIGQIADGLVTSKQVVERLRRQFPDALEDPLLQAQLYQLVTEFLASRYWELSWERSQLANYKKQARELYLTQPDMFRGPVRVDFSHVLIEVDEDTGEVDAMKQIVDVYANVRISDFATIAKSVSDDPEAGQNGGRYEDVELESLDPAVRSAIRKLKPGELSTPFRSQFGWHVVRLHTSDQSTPAFDQVTDQAIKAARSRHKTRLEESILREITSEPVNVVDGAARALIERHEKASSD
mgnify:CR=1 FL=1